VSELRGKVAVVTGANRGIGKGIARELWTRGSSVVLAARNSELLLQAATDISSDPGRVLTVAADITCENQVEALFAAAVERFGRVDLLINNAGAFDGGPVEDIGLAAWERVIGVCLTGAFLCTREAFRVMKPRGGGRIINIGSISAQRPRLHSAPYTAAKHGIWGLTQATALEGREHGIVVSCLHPGNVLVERRQAESKGSAGENMVVETDEPMMTVEEIARVAADMAALPPHVNFLEATVLPTRQAYLGRG
jgi:NAD(P)-dependent dehydrogenase (short-subunit alcohol dehydrogenase family)